MYEIFNGRFYTKPNGLIYYTYLIQIRRDCLGSVLASEQKRLVHNVPNESMLSFGDDLPRRCSDIKATNNLLIKPKSPEESE